MLLRPWSDAGLAVLEAANTATMKAKLGGPETRDQVLARHQRYLASNRVGDTEMFVVEVDGGAVGSIGYWPRHWREQQVYETGWEILSPFQGCGFAKAAGRLLIEHLRSVATLDWVHAYPSPDNPASNAICRALGFTLLGATQFEYPPGSPVTVNDWQLNLRNR